MTATLTGTPTQTVHDFLAAFAARDVQAAIALVAGDAAITVHPLHVQGAGKDALRAVLDEVVAAFPDLLLTVQRVITTGDVATALVKFEGTQARDYAGVVNQEKHLDLDQAWRFTVTNGRISAISTYWCQQQLYRRLAVKRFDQIAIV
jgi:steroid delta-isomerase-like uncharacterized protein